MGLTPRKSFMEGMLGGTGEGYVTSGSASRRKYFRAKKFIESPPENYNTNIPPQQLFSTKRIILAGIVLVGFLLIGTLYDSDWKNDWTFEFPKLINPFSEITDIIIPPPPLPVVKVHKDIWEEFSYVALGAENICDNQNCQDQLNEVYKITDCETMIKFYKTNSKSIIIPALAKQILDVCWDEYHTESISESITLPPIELDSSDIELTWMNSTTKIEWMNKGYTMRLTNNTSNEIGILHTCSESNVFESCIKIESMRIEWHSDGTKMFIVKDNEILELSCEAWDISTCKYTDPILHQAMIDKTYRFEIEIDNRDTP